MKKGESSCGIIAVVVGVVVGVVVVVDIVDVAVGMRFDSGMVGVVLSPSLSFSIEEMDAVDDGE